MASELPAGRELDALVTERLGLDRMQWGNGSVPMPFSQSWAAMGALVAHLVGQHWLVSMTAMADGLFGASCELRRGEMLPSQRPMACGDTVPHAVARAALQTARPPAPGVE